MKLGLLYSHHQFHVSQPYEENTSKHYPLNADRTKIENAKMYFFLL